MKQLVAVRSNAYFVENEHKESFSLEAQLELVIIFTDGKDYKWKKAGGIVSENKLTETRMLISSENLAELITELQLHQKKLQACRDNSDKINALIKHISDIPENGATV